MADPSAPTRLRRLLRYAIRFLVMLGVTWTIGQVGATVLSPTALDEMIAVQDDVCRGVARVSPLALTDRFLELAIDTRLGVGAAPAEDDGCFRALTGAAWPFTGKTAAPQSGENWARGESVIVRGLAAGAQTAWEAINQPSLWGSIIAVIQLLIGFGVTIAIARANADPMNGPSPIAIILLVPLGTIFFGSLAAFALQLFMLLAIALFSGIVQLAALAAAVSGVGGAAWWIAVKSGERGAESVVGRLIR